MNCLLLRTMLRICCMALLPVSLSAQRFEYDMTFMGSKIGSMVAERKVSGDTEIYTLKNSSKVKILWKEYIVDTYSRVVYKNGVLTEARYEYKDKGVLEKHCSIERSTSGYSVKHYKKGDFSFSELAKTGLVYLYFHEPKEMSRVFDETRGEYIPLSKTGGGQYEYKNSDGEKVLYKYVNGRIEEGEFHTSIAKAKMTLRK